ncbi:ferric reductase-like transmembrane domain-containing protein [Kitasatospora kifunensis]|uniref:DMSO/TMAO reductase YedYZ heme-binding membrane subunit n=1 Tax=Kitasatospora kifunensis TaxID=58351 RepID=A0A7W7W0J2_KITKI|nr:ferric reductase-like transmembrane domain-containing protein [Kitasatospora kifunensis]MBB4928799.1 DMSO/TMAO reductase YedYZ heme-binding membrane subunit [Kitasatospora kifunensis]
MTLLSDAVPRIDAGTPSDRVRIRIRIRTRSLVPAGVVAAVLALALVLFLFLAQSASATAPIPGSPLDAYDKGIPYDVGVHKIARLAAMISYALMVATMVLGVVLRMRYFQRYVNRRTVYGAHMTLALSTLTFGALHGLTFCYQPVWDIRLANLLLPFTGGLQRMPVGFGILGTELAIAVGCSVWLQQRIGYRRWLRFHQFAYVAFGLIWLHIFTVHPEPRHTNLVALAVAAGALGCLLAFLIRALPSSSRLRRGTFTNSVDGIQ